MVNNWAILCNTQRLRLAFVRVCSTINSIAMFSTFFALWFMFFISFEIFPLHPSSSAQIYLIYYNILANISIWCFLSSPSISTYSKAKFRVRFLTHSKKWIFSDFYIVYKSINFSFSHACLFHLLNFLNSKCPGPTNLQLLKPQCDHGIIAKSEY